MANTWTAIANIPRATGETRAFVINNEMWVLGGGISDPSNQVNIYNPCSNTWRLGPSFVTARRNFPTDTDGSRIWLAGGFDPSGSPVNTMEIFVLCSRSPKRRLTKDPWRSRRVQHSAAPYSKHRDQCRQHHNDHTIVVTLADPVTLSRASVAAGAGSVGSVGAERSGGHCRPD